MPGKKVLIGSPVRQDPLVLDCFLLSLKSLEKDGLDVSYYFVDNNENDLSSRMLESFQSQVVGRCTIKKTKPSEVFVKDQTTHFWTPSLISHVAALKNEIIGYALEHGFDYLFLVDSDLILCPQTLVRLVQANKHIIAEIFWTKWRPEMPSLPQVWVCDQYTLFEVSPGETLSAEEASERQKKWLEMLQKPGIYRVGGLGACTLISREVLEKGVNFTPLYNLTFWGEDRHFCIRAVAQGFELYVDTHCPAFHFYRESDFPQALSFMAEVGLISQEASRNLLQLIGCVQSALTFYGTTESYKDDLEAGLSLFAPEVREGVRKERMKVKEEVEKGHIITYTEIEEIFPLSFTLQGASFKAKVTNYGLYLGRNFHQSLTANVSLRAEQGCWLVSSVQFQPIPQESPKRLPFESRVVKNKGNRITLAMVVRNEADRYLREMLTQVKQIIDNAVVIDDGSTDETPYIVKQILDNVPLTLIRHEKPMFEENEWRLRQKLWHEVISRDPDWILCLDADEMFEEKALSEIRELVNNPEFDYYSFRIYDFWDKEHYREDSLWNAHLRYHILLIRYQPKFQYVWPEKPLHCGRFPANVALLPGLQLPLRVKHFGWANPNDRLRKYLLYKKLDPHGKYGDKAQYESILDQFPCLIKWRE